MTFFGRKRELTTSLSCPIYTPFSSVMESIQLYVVYSIVVSDVLHRKDEGYSEKDRRTCVTDKGID